MHTIAVSVRPPYDWATMSAFYVMRQIVGVEHATPERYTRIIVVDGRVGHLTVTPAADGLSVTTDLDGVLPRVRQMFDTELDPARIAAHFANDPVIAPLVALRPGLRIPNGWNGYELAVRAVLGQQITVVQAAKLGAKLVAQYGTRIADDGPLTHTFPEPSKLVDADIAALGMPGARGATIRNVARAVLDDPTIFDPGQTAERLRGLKGIGAWTAHYIAMRAMGDRDAFPASDIGLLRAMADKDGVRPTAKALMQRAEAWRPLRAYAAQHLWSADAAALQPSSRIPKGRTENER